MLTGVHLARNDSLGSEREPHELHDVADRDELRQRYYGLLQELRVIVPGVQVLMAFLLTVPFADRFEDLDDVGRGAYIVALTSALGAVVCLMAPTVFHRVADRRARAARLIWGVRVTVIGIALLAVSLTSATWCITRFVFDTVPASVVTGGSAAFLVGLWVVLPAAVGHHRSTPEGRSPSS